MTSERRAAPFLLLLPLFLLALSCRPTRAVGDWGGGGGGGVAATPAPWPEKYHVQFYVNMSRKGRVLLQDMWYDWPNRRALLITQPQLRKPVYYVQLDGNRTSFTYTLGAPGFCRAEQSTDKIDTPDFLQEGSTYLGRAYAGGFLCDLWGNSKERFLYYYEDVATRRPVRLDWDKGTSMHTITFEAGAVLEDSQWQAPAYCFNKGKGAGRGSRQPPELNKREGSGGGCAGPFEQVRRRAQAAAFSQSTAAVVMT